MKLVQWHRPPQTLKAKQAAYSQRKITDRQKPVRKWVDEDDEDQKAGAEVFKEAMK